MGSVHGRPQIGRFLARAAPSARFRSKRASYHRRVIAPSPPLPAIRFARRADLPAIVALFNATIPGRTATAQLEPVTVEERIPWFEASTPHERPLWVAEDATGDVVGWVGLSDFYIRAAYKPTAQVSIYLREDQRGRGLGGRLLDHAVVEAPGAGVTALIGLVFAHNAPSLRLFESRGFDRWGHMPRVANMDGVWRDLVHVGRHVP